MRNIWKAFCTLALVSVMSFGYRLVERNAIGEVKNRPLLKF